MRQSLAVLCVAMLLMISAVAADFPGSKTSKTAKAAAIPPAPAGKKNASSAGRWQVEVHGGGLFSGSPTAGSGSVPAGGTFSNAILSGQSLLSYQSYFFGGGASALNAFAGTQAGTPGAFGQRIVPLDPALTRNNLERTAGGSAGMRLSYDLNPRVSLEFNADYANSSLQLTKSTIGQVNATTASWAATWNDLNAHEPVVVTSTTSNAVIHRNNGGGQMFYTGNVNFNLKTEGKVIPYITVGGGVQTPVGGAPYTTLLGHYAFDVFGAIPIAADDIVSLSYRDTTSAVFSYGLGFKYNLTPRWGLRFDGRGLLSGNNVENRISASPSTLVVPPGTGIFGNFPTNAAGTERFILSDDPSLVPDSLQLSANKVRTFRGSGARNQGNFSVGLFYRF